MDTHRPPTDQPDPTVSTVLRKLEGSRRAAWEEELDELEIQEVGIKRRKRWLLDKILPKRGTDELTQVAHPTPPAFQMSPELQQERQRVSDSLNQPRPATHSDPPTQQLNNPADIARIAAMDTVVMHATDPAIPQPEPARPRPRQTTYKITDLLMAIPSAIQNHIDRCSEAPDRIFMKRTTKHLFEVLNMENYILHDKTVEFFVNDDPDLDEHTLICITY